MKKNVLNKTGIFLLCFCLAAAFVSCRKKEQLKYKFPFHNPDLSTEERINDLVARMTLEEKVSQLVYDAPSVERLDIPAYNWWNEALHGVARAGRATVFPQAIGLAAAWDSDLMFRVATVISDEARAKHHEFVRRGKRGIYEGLTFWSPNINIFRDPRWGRGMETYGEDPYLTGKMAVQFVKGLQGNDPHYLKTVSTPKHFAVHSGPEPDRHTFNAVVDERDLRETYLPAFRMCIVDANAYSVMCSYNRYMGEACCGSDRLLKQILRGEWGFDGYVVSDCGAISNIYKTHKIVETSPQAAAVGIKAGCDLNCGREYKSLLEAVAKGYISEEELDVSVKRLFRARFRLGMFDPPDRVPYARIPYEVNDCKKHQEMALDTARKSIVLLKNERNVLPLKKDIKTIAVIGPNADDVEVLLGNYNGTPSNPITLLDGIRKKVSPDSKVLYAEGCFLAENLPSFHVIPSEALRTPDGREGLKAEYFDNREFEGEPVFTRIDKEIDFNWWDRAPREGLDDDNFGVRWTGELIPPVTGKYTLTASAFGGLRVFLEDALLLHYDSRHHPRTTSKDCDLEAGKSYGIKVEFYEHNSDATVRLSWSRPSRNMKEEAVQAAEQADIIVMAMGISPQLEGEEMEVNVKGFKGGDRLDLKLPDTQEELLKAIFGLGKPVVLVLLNGSALGVNWADEHIPAIVEAWYPGQAAGTAIADVLFGDYNPAGRLPVTFYKSVNQLPSFDDYSMKGRTYRYFDGEPLYPFGHGLSYTSFEYSNLTLPEKVDPSQEINITVDVRNTGQTAGEEVVQLYVSDVEASVPVPIRSLQGFRRIYLEPGTKKSVNFVLTTTQLSLISLENKRVVEPGVFEVAIGGKQPGFKGTADAPTTGVITGKFEVSVEVKKN